MNNREYKEIIAERDEAIVTSMRAIDTAERALESAARMEESFRAAESTFRSLMSRLGRIMLYASDHQNETVADVLLKTGELLRKATRNADFEEIMGFIADK